MSFLYQLNWTILHYIFLCDNLIRDISFCRIFSSDVVIISGTTRYNIGLGNGLERIRVQSGLRPLREPMMTKTYDVTGFTSLDYVIDCV